MEIPEHFLKMKDGKVQRCKTASMLIQILMSSKQFAEESQGYKEAIVAGCERGVFNRAVTILRSDSNHIISWTTPQFVAAYHCARQNLCQRLAGIESNPHLEDIVIKKTIDWADLCSVPIHKLLPDVFSQQTQLISERKAAEVEITYDKGNCTECGSHKIKYMSDQTQSADESSTPSVFCYQCNSSIS